MRIRALSFIILTFGAAMALEIEAEIQRATNIRNPLLAQLSDLTSDFEQSVIDLYTQLNDVIGMELDVDEDTSLTDLLFKIVTYRQQAISTAQQEECKSLNDMLGAIDLKIKEAMDVKEKKSKDEIAELFNAALLQILGEIQTQLTTDLLCQFQRELAKDSDSLSFHLHMNLFVETQRRIGQQLDWLQNHYGHDMSEEKLTAAQVLVNYQQMFVDSKILPIQKIVQLLKAPVRALKQEVVLLLLTATKSDDLTKLKGRFGVLVDAASKALSTTNEEASYMQMYIIAASLKTSVTENQQFQGFIDQALKTLINKLYEAGREAKAIELLSNLATRKLQDKVQPVEFQKMMTEILYSAGFPADFDSGNEYGLMNALWALDELAYINSNDITEDIFRLSIESLPELLKIPTEAIALHNAPKFAFSNSLIDIPSHLSYYQSLYEIALIFTATKPDSKPENWAIEIQPFIDQYYSKQLITIQNYLIMKIHCALYIPSESKASVSFENFELFESVFANDKFPNFKNILQHIWSLKNEHVDVLPSDVQICNWFSGKTLSSDDLGFLQIKIDYREKAEEIQANSDAQVKIILQVKHQAPVESEIISEPVRRSVVGEANFQNHREQKRGFRPIPPDENIIIQLAGILPPEEFEKLKRMEFVDYVKGKKLTMKEGEVEHQYMIVQRISKSSKCTNRLQLA